MELVIDIDGRRWHIFVDKITAIRLGESAMDVHLGNDRPITVDNTTGKALLTRLKSMKGKS